MIQLTTPTANALGHRLGWPGRASMRLILLSLASRLPAQSGGVTLTQSFSYTGQLETFTVPTGGRSLTIEARGAEGGGQANSDAAAEQLISLRLPG